MAQYSVAPIDKKDEWERFVLSQDPQSFLQSWNWGETNKLVGSKVFRLGFFDGKTLVGAAQLIEERARRGSYFLIPGGPLIDWKNKELVAFVLSRLRELGRREGVWFIRTRPDVLDTQTNKKLFATLGFISSPMHLHAENTWVLDITLTEDELLKNMRKTTRYLIKQSNQKGLTLKMHADAKSMHILTSLQQETVRRHKFVGFSQKLFESQLETFGGDNQALLFVCEKDEEPLAAAIIIFYGKYAYYHHSGSTSKYRDLPFSYFLQWGIIKEAKRRGFKGYNFWGIAPNDDPKHRFAGVTTFKKGFGGEKIDWLHAQDLPLSPLYWATYTFESVRKRVRRL